MDGIIKTMFDKLKGEEYDIFRDDRIISKRKAFEVLKKYGGTEATDYEEFEKQPDIKEGYHFRLSFIWDTEEERKEHYHLLYNECIMEIIECTQQR